LAIQCHNNDVYAAGSFKNVGNNVRSQGIAKWNGSNWEAMDKGVAASYGTFYSVQDIAIDSKG